MILGALSVSTAVASEREDATADDAVRRECTRYQLDYDRIARAEAEEGQGKPGRAWWDYAIVAAAVSVFVYLAWNAHVPNLGMNMGWVSILSALLVASAVGCGWGLWKATRFS
jgi:hypothetical protein